MSTCSLLLITIISTLYLPTLETRLPPSELTGRYDVVLVLSMCMFVSIDSVLVFAGFLAVLPTTNLKIFVMKVIFLK